MTYKKPHNIKYVDMKEINLVAKISICQYIELTEEDKNLIEKTKKAFPCMGYSLEEDIKITKKDY